ncbi:MAG: ribonuclease P protein component [Pseudomonadota bacterium]
MQSTLVILTKRNDFVALSHANRATTPGLVLQARQRRDECDDIRVGFTCSKKIGGAIQRNRAKRRLREIAKDILPDHGKLGWDYVLVGRVETTISRDFLDLKKDLVQAIKNVHGGKKSAK